MAKKKEIPVTENPLANMELDDIVREIVASKKAEPTLETENEIEPDENSDSNSPAKSKRRSSLRTKRLDENLKKYTGISEQGVAIWIPKDVKKQLEMIRINSDRNIPLRSLAAAIIMTYIEENGSIMENI